jgi:hypothetical protein
MDGDEDLVRDALVSLHVMWCAGRQPGDVRDRLRGKRREIKRDLVEFLVGKVQLAAFGHAA